MKQWNTTNINSRTYWNDIYATPEKRKAYAEAGTDNPHGAMGSMYETSRFDRALTYVNPGDKVLDLGCGVGVFTKMVKDAHPSCEVIGVDISDRAMSDNALLHPGIEYKTHHIGRDKLTYRDCDLVFSGETLEHLDEPKDLLIDAHTALKTGGCLIITTPNGTNITSSEHTWIFSHEDVEQLYQENGFARPEFVYLPKLEHLMVIMAVGRKL